MLTHQGALCWGGAEKERGEEESGRKEEGRGREGKEGKGKKLSEFSFALSLESIHWLCRSWGSYSVLFSFDLVLVFEDSVSLYVTLAIPELAL